MVNRDSGDPSSGGVEPEGDRPRHRELTRLMLGRRVVQPALKVSLVVGTALNLINNGELLWNHQGVNLWRLLLNYAVPFFVSSYSAAKNEVQKSRRD